AVEVVRVLRARPGEVDSDLLAGDLDGRAYDELAVDRLDDVFCRTRPVRKASNRCAHHALRVRVQLVHRPRHALAAAPTTELVDAPPGEAMRGDLRAQVAAPLIGIGRVGDEEVDDLVRERRRRDDESLLIELA